MGLPCSSLYQGAAEAGELFTSRSAGRRLSAAPPPCWRVGADPVCFWCWWEERRRPDRRETLAFRPAGLSRRFAAGRTARGDTAVAAAVPPPKATRCRPGLSATPVREGDGFMGLRELALPPTSSSMSAAEPPLAPTPLLRCRRRFLVCAPSYWVSVSWMLPRLSERTEF